MTNMNMFAEMSSALEDGADTEVEEAMRNAHPPSPWGGISFVVCLWCAAVSTGKAADGLGGT